MGKPSYDQLKLNVAELKEKVEALEIERDGLKLTAEGVAEAHEAAMEAVQFRQDTAERLAAILQDRLDDMEAPAPDDEPPNVVVPERENMMVLNTTKNRLEIQGFVINPGCVFSASSELLADDRMFRRVSRALEIGVLKEVK